MLYFGKTIYTKITPILKALQIFAGMLPICFQPFPLINTERLILRQIVAADVQDILSMRSDKKVMRYIDRLPVQSEEEALQLIQKITEGLDKNEGITWGIALKDEPGLIGTIGFWRIDKENYRGEIGYMLMTAHHRKGITQEALTAVLRHGFDTIHLHSVEGNVNIANEASMKLLEKFGFVKEAHFKENYYFNGQFLDSIIYSLLAPK